MPGQKPCKTIFYTNLWISFLIGRELHNLKDLIVNGKIQLITTDQLINELRIVTSRRKLKKYFEPEKVEELISLLEIISKKVKIKKLNPSAGTQKMISCSPWQNKARQISW